jgi:nucleotide-binding universal stress UspA family protein
VRLDCVFYAIDEAAIAMKTILVPIEDNNAMGSALQTALILARRCDSYIEGFALRWPIAELSAAGMMGAVVFDGDQREIARMEMQARTTFESFMQKNGVPRSTTTTDSVSFGWLENAPPGDSFVGSHGRVFDVIVMNRSDRNATDLHHQAINSGLFESGRPILLAPPSPPSQIGTNILIAWNRSTEQARATAFAMPLLQKADRVTVLTVIGGTEVPGPSAEQLTQYLWRNGIGAELRKAELGGRNTGETILATAQSLGCDLLIKGAYTQSRFRQMIFGGATQHVLDNAMIPVLLAH